MSDDVFPGIQAERVQHLNDRSADPDDLGEGHVLYWMQQSVRVEYNHALEYAVRSANELQRPLLVAFGLTDDYPEANLRHYTFLVEGLADVAAALAKRKITFVVRKGSPEEVAITLARQACLVVCDRGYLRHQRRWREKLAREVRCPVVQVESDVVVPVELASDKRESAARTLRPKISKHLDRFLVPLRAATLRDHSTVEVADTIDVSDPERVLRGMTLDRDVPAVPDRKGGTTEGKKVLQTFLRSHLDQYAANRNQVQTDHVSHVAAYLHYGHLSPVAIALAVSPKNGAGTGSNVESFLEELIIRRELPMNYVFYEPHYDRYDALPDFAKKTLAEHASDQRKPQYTRGELEAAKTEDPYWNAAMTEMKLTGYLHNHLRMYWGKKILEWSSSPQTAYRTTLYLNNRYFLDGRDANSFANVAWIFGAHDRGWTERPVFGKVRSMTAGGLERKSDPKAYVDKINKLAEKLGDKGSD